MMKMRKMNMKLWLILVLREKVGIKFLKIFVLKTHLTKDSKMFLKITAKKLKLKKYIY